MTPSRKLSLVAAAVISSLSTAVLAVEPMEIKVKDGLAFTPTLKLGAAYDDNFRAVEDNAESSWITADHQGGKQ